MVAGDDLAAKVGLWIELMRPDSIASYDEAVRFVRQNPQWPAQTTLRKTVERLMAEELPASEVLRFFSETPPQSAVGKMRYADALLRSGDSQRGVELLRRVWAEDGLPDALESKFLSLYGGYITRRDDVTRLDRLLWDRNGQARRQAQRLGNDYVLLADARLALSSGNATAAKSLARVPAALQSNPGLLYDRAVWARRKDDAASVVALLNSPGSTTVRPDAWWSLRNWTARQRLDDGDAAGAYGLVSQHGMQEGSNFAEAEWLAGFISLRFLNDPARAMNHFARFTSAVATPVSEARGAYWMGRAADAAGDREAALERYRAAVQDGTTFYGQLAAARLGRPLQIGGVRGQPSAAERAQFASRELVRAATLLNDMGERRWADLFLNEIVRTATPADGVLVAELAVSRGRPGQAMAVARALRARGIVVPDHLFPVMAVKPVGSEDPALVLAIIRQESGFNPEAVSSAGALGLMQLMPGTAREVAGKLGVGYSPASLTAAPDYNMMLGQTYLAQLLDRFEGSMLLSVAGYNAGPGNVRKWLDRYGDPRYDNVDVIDWIERIPLSETRNYVQRVFEGLHAYRHRLNPGSAPMPLSPELKIQVASAR